MSNQVFPSPLALILRSPLETSTSLLGNISSLMMLCYCYLLNSIRIRRRVVWLSDAEKDKGYAVDFLSVSLHAVSTDPEAYPLPCIYAQVLFFLSAFTLFCFNSFLGFRVFALFASI